MSSHRRHHYHHHNSSFTSCFFPPTPTPTANTNHSAPLPLPPPPPLPSESVSGKPNLTTCLYHTHLGIFSLTWYRSLFGHSLHLNLHPFDYNFSPLSLSNNSLSFSSLSFHLHIKPFLFWKKQGSKKLTTITTRSRVQIFWDLSRVRFGSGPEPQSGFYIAVVVDGEIALLVGDSTKEAYAKIKLNQKPKRTQQILLLRREHVFGNRVYTTKARFGGKTRDILIDCNVNGEGRLNFSVDNERVLQIKKLKWKFRGNEKIEIDGVPIQVSWDVYNWLFEDSNHGHAVFMFRFDNTDCEEEEEQDEDQNGVVPWQQQGSGNCSLGMSGIEWRKMRKSLMMRTARSSSSSSISMMSSASSSGCSSSVMEWASSTDETELSPRPNGFSLLVYVWKK